MGCEARDYHIASLKEQLHYYQQIDESERRTHHDDLSDIIKHVTGMNRVQSNTGPLEFKPVRRDTSIAARIRHAESVDAAAAAPEVARRNKEYNERIERELSGIRPEVEVKDAVGPGNAQVENG